MATLTFAYADSTAVVGPLATAAEPHSYDLCADHALGLKAPRGWEVVRPDAEFDPVGPAHRRPRGAGQRRPRGRPGRAGRSAAPAASPSTGRRGHLRVLRFPTDDTAEGPRR